MKGKEKILVVDDEADLVLNLKSAISSAGYEVFTASCGAEAVESVARNLPDIAILDVMMPEMDGFETCERIKANPRTADTSVIFLSARDLPASRIKGLDRGADDYITKPFNQDELFARIRSVCRLRDYRQRLSVMVEFGKSINVLKMELLISELKKRLVDVFTSDLFSIFTWDGDKKSFTLLASNHPELADNGGMAVPAAESPFMKEVVERKDAVLVEEFSRSSFAKTEKRKKYMDDFALGVPLDIGGETIGVLNLNGNSRGFFEGLDLTYIRLGAEHLAASVSNAIQHGKIEEMAVTDGMTGIHNYRYFYEHFRSEWARTRRYGEPISVIIMDIDFFKKVNDTYGHLSGDLVLRAMGALLKRMARLGDTMARYGGEEFVALLPHTRKEEAAVLAERIRKEIESTPVQGEKEIIRVTMSFGVADSLHADLEKCEDLIGAADERLYKAKHSGRNMVVFT